MPRAQIEQIELVVERITRRGGHEMTHRLTAKFALFGQTVPKRPTIVPFVMQVRTRT